MATRFRQRILLSLAFGALVFIGLTIYADAGRLIAAFARFPWIVAPIVIACSSANYAFRYWKWDYYTRVLGIRPATEKNLIIFFAAFLMAVTPGKFGEVLKSYLLKQVNGTPISRSAPIILAERLTDFIGLVLLLLVGAWVFGQFRSVIAAMAVSFFGVTLLLSWRRGSVNAIRLLERLPFIGRFAHHAHNAYDSVYALLRPGPLAIAVAISVVSWFCECAGYWVILRAFDTPPTLLKATFIYAFSTIVGALSMLPGGLGTTEGSLTTLSILAGAPKDIAVASTFIIRIATLWFAVFIGVVVTFAFQQRLKVRIDEIQIEQLPEVN